MYHFSSPITGTWQDYPTSKAVQPINPTGAECLWQPAQNAGYLLLISSVWGWKLQTGKLDWMALKTFDAILTIYSSYMICTAFFCKYSNQPKVRGQTCQQMVRWSINYTACIGRYIHIFHMYYDWIRMWCVMWLHTYATLQVYDEWKIVSPWCIFKHAMAPLIGNPWCLSSYFGFSGFYQMQFKQQVSQKKITHAGPVLG